MPNSGQSEPPLPPPVPVTLVDVSPDVVAKNANAPPGERLADAAIPTNAPPTTTAAADLVTAGQRRINVLWETTQAVLAVVFGVTTAGTCSYIAVAGATDAPTKSLALSLLGVGTTAVMSTYFARTNHTKTGGAGNTEGKER